MEAHMLSLENCFSFSFSAFTKWKWSLSVMSDSLWPMDCSPSSSSIHGILQARILEWVAISFSRGTSWLRDRTQVSCIAGRCFNLWTTREYSACKLNKQGDNIPRWCTPFPIWNQSVVSRPVLTVAVMNLLFIQICQEAGQMVWYSHLFQNFPQFIVIQTVKGFGIVIKPWYL